MSDERSPDPSDNDLIALARKLLGGESNAYADEKLLRETVLEARTLWLLLYHAHPHDEP